MQTPDGAFFEGECVPNLDDIETIFTNWDGEVYPHAWRGAILCFTLGLFVCVVTGIALQIKTVIKAVAVQWEFCFLLIKFMS